MVCSKRFCKVNTMLACKQSPLHRISCFNLGLTIIVNCGLWIWSVQKQRIFMFAFSSIRPETWQRIALISWRPCNNFLNCSLRKLGDGLFKEILQSKHISERTFLACKCGGVSKVEGITTGSSRPGHPADVGCTIENPQTLAQSKVVRFPNL